MPFCNKYRCMTIYRFETLYRFVTYHFVMYRCVTNFKERTVV
jgi:hypothetical protein